MSSDSGSPRLAVLAGDDSTAIETVLRGMRMDSGVAVIVACRDATAGVLRSNTMWPVIDVRDHERLDRDRVYVVPPDVAATVHRGELVLVGALATAIAPIDRLLRSVADAYAGNAIAVILGGAGADGAIGLKRFKEAGGFTIVQEPEPNEDPDSEMRSAAIATGMVDVILPVGSIAQRIISFASTPPPAVLAMVDGDESTPEPDAITNVIRDILAVVRARTGHDFALYKRATVYRRIARRMQVCQTSSLIEYLRHLREQPLESSHLLRDFLISVTNFFRDADEFQALADTVIPRLFVRHDDPQLRVWVAGCATGEEAYSIAMLLVERASRIGDHRMIQVFATDIDEPSLGEARVGRYPQTIAHDVSPERLERFFTRETQHYRVRKELRELILFSPHNVLRDPPFSRIDLVTCRNLLIYLNREAQARVLNMFHFGLRPEGLLFLGSSEAGENANHQFDQLDGKHQFYQRRSTPSGLLDIEAFASTGRWQVPPIASPVGQEDHVPAAGELHHRLVERYAPPSVLVDDALDVLHVSEHAGKFLQHEGGEVTRQLFRMVHPGLRTDLRAAIHAARSTDTTQTRIVQFDDASVARTIDLRVRAVDTKRGRTFLVMFDEIQPPVDRVVLPATTSIEPVVRELEDALHRTRDQLRTTIEQYETSLEELKASNEELQAMNEELRSAGEELETSKEELQSVNEELTTVNHELKFKVDEVGRTNSDLQNLMTSTDIAVVFLDRALAVKRYTPRARELFNLIPGDLGRPLAHVTHQLDRQDLLELAQVVLHELRPITREVRSTDQRRYLTRIAPYRALDDRIDGVVMTFADVTELRDAVEARDRSEAALQVTSERLRMSLRGAPMVAIALDAAGGPTWSYTLGTEHTEDAGKVLLLFAPAHAPRFLQVSREVYELKQPQRIELELIVDGGRRTFDFRIEPSDGGTTAVGFDITPSKQAELSLREADRRKDEFLATLSHELRNPLTPLRVALDVAKLAEHDPDLQRKSRDIIERQAVQLTQLVDDLLDLSRITQGKMTLDKQMVDPISIVEAALETMRPELKEHAHQLEVTLPSESVRIMADRARMVQVLCNLLGNAIKYTPDRGSIWLAVDVDHRRSVLVARVKDNGVGIDPTVHHHIFELFVQSRDSLGRAAGGLGIGLNLVRRLVQLHGGTVSATSAGPGTGSEFTLELPLVKEPP